MGELSCLLVSELNGACDDAATIPSGSRDDKFYTISTDWGFFAKVCV